MAELNVLSISPSNSATGQALKQPIVITFDSPIDLDSIKNGSIGLFTLAKDLIIAGPDYTASDSIKLFDKIIEDNPNSYGFIECDYFFSVNNTVVTLIPKSQLLPNTSYKVLVNTDVSTATIGEINTDLVAGTGTFAVSGPYSGETEETLNIEITATGASGVATFQWWYSSAPLERSYNMNTAFSVFIENGIVAHFREGSFTLGDTYVFNVTPPTFLTDAIQSEFSTSNLNYVNPPETIETISLVGDSVVNIGKTPIELVSSLPDQDLPVLRDWTTFSFEFNQTIQEPEESDISIYYKAIETYLKADGAKHNIPFTFEVSGRFLYITLDLSSFENEVIPFNQDLVFVLKLKNSLNQPSTVRIEYMSELYPIYVDEERIRLDAGRYIGPVPVNTVYRLVYNMSKKADALNFMKIDNTDPAWSYYEQIRGEYIVSGVLWSLFGLTSQDGRVTSKRLGDLFIQGRINDPMRDKMRDEFGKRFKDLEYQIKNGGYEYAAGSFGARKARYDPNRVIIGRQWDGTVKTGQLPAGNIRYVYQERGYITGYNVQTYYGSDYYYYPQYPYSEIIDKV